MTKRMPLSEADLKRLEDSITPLLWWAAKWRVRYGLQAQQEAKDLVNEVLAVMMEKGCPAGVDVVAYAYTDIKQEAFNAGRRKAKFHVERGRDAPPPEDLQPSATMATDQTAVLLDLTNQTMSRLYEMTEHSKDQEVQMLLLAFQDGQDKRSKIAQELGWTLGQFDAAKKRLETLLERLPPELRTQILDEIGATP